MNAASRSRTGAVNKTGAAEWRLKAAGLVVAGSMLLAGAPAFAGVGISATVVFPNVVTVPQTNLAADLVITYRNTPPNNTNGNVITNVRITPACGTNPVGSASCPAGSVEAGVPTPISLSATGIGNADCQDPAAPNVVPPIPRQFTISPPAAPGGTWQFTPDFYLPVGGSCIISFSINVNSRPTMDASADPLPPPQVALSGLQTAVLAGASATDAILGATGQGTGSALVSFPELTTIPGPGGTLGGAPINLSDSARITGLVPDAFNNPPTGTVTFNLYSPNDAACAAAAQSETVNLGDPARCTITPGSFEVNCTTGQTHTVNTAGVWRWGVTYNPGGANMLNNVAVNSPCAAEPVTIARAQPVLTTIPTPSPGRFGAPLNDTAQLSPGAPGSPPYSGSITFNLFDPTQANCTGVPRYTQTVAVSAAGAAVTAPGFVADQVGTWQWTANYNGDANNLPAVSGCGAEPVVVPSPVLTIVKTPDGATYGAGQNISFTILVTNTGPGTATNVRLSPPDALPDPNASLQWGISQQPAGNPCTVSGNPGTQVLNCNFGNMIEGATASVTVQSATSAADPGDCGNPLVLNNSATVIADNAPTPRNDTASLRCAPNQTVIVTTPVPTTGSVGGAPLNDTAQLSVTPAPGPGAPVFTGNIVFNLYDSTQPNCTGAPRFTQTVPVSGAGAATTTGGFVADMSGTWNWTAVYSGDANYLGATSGCGAEQVSIGRPVLTIAKTPDATTYTPGQTITWTIVVTNAGPGTALGVRFTPADRLPDPNASLNWSVTQQPAGGSCTISGAIGSQDLNCNFGNMLQGTSNTVIVSSATSAADPGDCPAGAPLTNNVTVIANNADPKTDTGTQTCVGRAVIALAKTPDAGYYAPGDTIAFSIAVSSTGQIAANNVRFDPVDTLPDPNKSLNWSIAQQPAAGTCTLGGSIGAQTLSCNFGTMAPGTTRTVRVSTATQASDPGDCSRPLVLNNSVTVVSDNADPRTDTGSLICDTPAAPIPTLSNLGLLLLLALFAGTGCAVLRRRQV